MIYLNKFSTQELVALKLETEQRLSTNENAMMGYIQKQVDIIENVNNELSRR